MKRFISALCIASLLYPHSIGWAQTPTPTQTPDLRNFQDASLQDCNNVCNRIVGANGRELDVDDNGEWTDTDDQWCASRGISRGGHVAYSGPPTARSINQNCPFPVVNEGETCATLNDKMLRCEMRGSVTHNNCMVMRQSARAYDDQIAMVTLDSVAAGACTLSCVMTSIQNNSQWAYPCTIASTTNGIAQSIILTQINQNDAGMYAASIGSSLTGILGGAGMASTTALQQSAQTTTTTVSGNLPRAEFGANGGLNTGGPRFDAVTGDTVTVETTNTTDTTAEDAGTATACIMAGIFAGLAIARGANMGELDKSRKSACESITAQVAVDQNSIKRFLESGGESGGGRFGVTGGNGPVFEGRGNPFGTSTNVQSIDDALNNPLVSAAVDGGLLTRTGLGNSLKNRAPELAPGILDAARRGDNAGMLAAGLPKQAAAAAGVLANVGNRMNDKLKPGSMMAQVGSYSGGGGGARGPAAGGASPFAGLGAKNAGMGAGGPGAAMDFGGVAESTDIWHSNSSDNIFQIVSHRIHRVQRKQAFR